MDASESGHSSNMPIRAAVPPGMVDTLKKCLKARLAAPRLVPFFNGGFPHEMVLSFNGRAAL